MDYFREQEIIRQEVERRQTMRMLTNLGVRLIFFIGYFVYLIWKEIVCSAVLLVINLIVMSACVYLCVKAHWSIVVPALLMPLGYLISFGLLCLASRWLGVISAAVTGVLLLPIVIVAQLGTVYSVDQEVVRNINGKLRVADVTGPTDNRFLSWDLAQTVFVPEIYLLDDPLHRLKEAWQHELSLPELHKGDHSDPRYQSQWLKVYLQKNVPKLGLRDYDKVDWTKTLPDPNAVLDIPIPLSDRIQKDVWPNGNLVLDRLEFQEYGYDDMLGFYQFLLFAGLYFMPGIYAYRYNVPKKLTILICNAFLGITIIGWFILFAMALKGRPNLLLQKLD